MDRDVEHYLPAWRKRLQEDAVALEKRRQEARDAANRMARILVEEFAARRVFLVGSLLNAESFGKHSDIDLVVEGLKPSGHFKALDRIWRELPKGMEVDLIPFEDAHESLQELTLKEGLLLHEQH